MQPVAPKRRARVLAGRLVATHLPARTRARRLIVKHHKSWAKLECRTATGGWAKASAISRPECRRPARRVNSAGRAVIPACGGLSHLVLSQPRSTFQF